MVALALALVLPLALGAPARTSSLAFVGDVCFRELPTTDGLFDAVRPLLERADLAVGNLEGLLLDDPVDAFRDPRINITAHSRFAAALAGSGLDLVGLSNNHTWDHGAAGLVEHLGHLARAHVASFGAARDEASARAAQRIELPAGCVAIVPATFKSNKRPPATTEAFAATYAIDDPAPLVARLAEERARGCLVVAYVHAGRERAALPTREVRRAFAELAAAADLVVGHHPHVLEGVALPHDPGDAVVAYSLGNFLFVNRDADKRRSGVLEVTISPGALAGPGAQGATRPVITRVALAPVTIDARTYLPRPATDAEARQTVKVLADRSRPFGTRVDWDGARVVFSRP
ncbi:MAG: CapA family protein [Deltaproteobacteria bacterium]|nr:CapA family protein [Deltaproteobacteria bacterium]